MKALEYLSILIIAIFMIAYGIFMLVNKIHVIGIKRNLDPNVVGGASLIFVGIIFLVVYYHSLSPYVGIRRFLEERKTKRRKK
ncbi:hypothetical protein ACFOUP_01800 [Belliella kenyensis]|uniref:Uncharacterized protein n=1 Tax=Belliella kenyensis TaxID=1472724 RepID=A0ABV8EGH6_9BACT|nr:hypothetical protein [Belliella kenyensis]MCH7401071.1 hypothetical protein [Belliella kenyensis]MDN3604069.1 hypothetical protein [Belliella kenyensis]